MKPTDTPADARYMAKRGLRRYAGAWHLWAMGVGAAIWGDCFGWNYGLVVGLMTAMYIGLCYSIAEMSAALPHATLAWFVLGSAYYAYHARKRLVLAPEEESAFAHRIEKPRGKAPA